ncbi:hypothetical protein GCM10010446_48840 [Streptomyces enissocaesilis]|uniref:Uncharacterized protein n=1 Tax=Streptomyces enissocaesilis TaxID=332589 RepID=A0ABN3XIC5_9ACTN
MAPGVVRDHVVRRGEEFRQDVPFGRVAGQAVEEEYRWTAETRFRVRVRILVVAAGQVYAAAYAAPQAVPYATSRVGRRAHHGSYPQGRPSCRTSLAAALGRKSPERGGVGTAGRLQLRRPIPVVGT